jgi:hypothetical protein
VAASDREIPAVDSHARGPLRPSFPPMWPARTSPGSGPPATPALGTPTHLHWQTQSSRVHWRGSFAHPPNNKTHCAPEATLQPTPGSAPLDAQSPSVFYSHLSITSVVCTCAFQGLPPPCVPCGEPLLWCPGFRHSLRPQKCFLGHVCVSRDPER